MPNEMDDNDKKLLQDCQILIARIQRHCGMAMGVFDHMKNDLASAEGEKLPT
jgi:hypothetical protein